MLGINVLKYLEKIIVAVLDAKAVFVLKKDGTWDYIGIPPEVHALVEKEEKRIVEEKELHPDAWYNQ